MSIYIKSLLCWHLCTVSQRVFHYAAWKHGFDTIAWPIGSCSRCHALKWVKTKWQVESGKWKVDGRTTAKAGSRATGPSTHKANWKRREFIFKQESQQTVTAAQLIKLARTQRTEKRSRSRKVNMSKANIKVKANVGIRSRWLKLLIRLVARAEPCLCLALGWCLCLGVGVAAGR